MNTEEIIRNQNRRKKPVRRSLIKVYLHRWYILVLTALTCIFGYAAEAILYGTLSAMSMTHFLAAIIAIFLGGIISTFPFFVYNLVLAFRYKRYSALVVTIIVLEIIGMLFFVCNQIGLAGV